MARPKKNTEPIMGTGKDPENKLTVQKSIPLFSLLRSDMTLSEFKILDTYLSRINSREPEKRTVVFTKGELEHLLGVTKINKADLTTRLNGLGRFIEVEQSDKKLHKVALFEEAYGEIDENGQWTIQLTCTQKAMKYIFNIEKLGYLRYKLRCITSLTSRYTYVLFLYLESNRYRKSWTVAVDELRQILNCDQDELYKEFKRLNERILKKCQKELLEKTECRFVYEPVKAGRRVTGVKFTLETLTDAIEAEIQDEDPDQITIFDIEDSENDDHILSEKRESICHGFGHKLFAEFSDEELIELRSLAWKLADPDVEARHYAILHDFKMARENAVADYIRSKILAMNVYGKRYPIKNRYSYLKKTLANE